jgi:hypothetical protein
VHRHFTGVSDMYLVKWNALFSILAMVGTTDIPDWKQNLRPLNLPVWIITVPTIAKEKTRTLNLPVWIITVPRHNNVLCKSVPPNNI